MFDPGPGLGVRTPSSFGLIRLNLGNSREVPFRETCLVPQSSMIPKDSRYEIGKQSANVGEKRREELEEMTLSY